MQVCIQKFGGSSLATSEGRMAAVRHVEQAVEAQQQVVVVVSAMGRHGDPYATDTLLDLLTSASMTPMTAPVNSAAFARDRDLLMSCGELVSATVFASLLRESGHPARVFGGGQAGVTTDGHFGDARILRVHPEALQNALTQGEIPVVAGFQGMTSEGEITTLGRGGSDTTAVALGVALQAQTVDIFTDVPGVMTADPQMVPQALCLPRISYAQCHALAQEGAKVLHPRAVALAMAHGLSVRVRSNFSDEVGTLVARSVSLEARTPTNPTFTGVAQRDRLIHVEFGNPQGTLSEVLFALSREKIGLEGVAMHEQRVTCTLSESDWARALQVMQAEGCTLYGEVPCARVTVVGEGIQHHPHVQAGLLSTLGEAQIPVLQLGDIRDGVWCLVEQRHLQAALGILHQTFVVHTQKTSKSQVPFVRRVLSTKDPVPVPAAR